ncbi:MAG: UTP--glucose-1-phosphate uridylyltransferase GalU [Rhodospirillaceae bacterium]|jgi:UTP--glucose-1-phosphate uridylyltransferase|nr:UTP--glucose-1-phosphate uridylyltransferase GalU [Rhodospirillaceae bacterium]MBT6205908.1 UTP--glucose-1-phosphate uridylyltransferase GalU [Rhodospirillaceae bacterium]MBT6512129.1 UTP--glucose-1-phosphate uridylyltransferase GalU [Rhodospirillaceae bacterium]
MTHPRVRKAVFPVAGLGTRFLPATKSMAKEMLTVLDRPLIQHAVDEAAKAGIEQFIFVNGRGKHAIDDHFDLAFELERTLELRGKTVELGRSREMVPAPGNVISVRQQQPLGLGHAVWCARHAVGNEPFAVFLADDLVMGDDPCIGQLIRQYEKTGGNVVAVQDVPREHTNRYGVLDVGEDDGHIAEVKGLVEKPEPEVAPSTLTIIGRYILLPQIFDHLESQKPTVGNEIQLTDAMAQLIGGSPFHGLRFTGTRFDCGTKLGFLQANLAYGLRDGDVGAELAAFAKNELSNKG